MTLANAEFSQQISKVANRQLLDMLRLKQLGMSDEQLYALVPKPVSVACAIHSSDECYEEPDFGLPDSGASKLLNAFDFRHSFPRVEIWCYVPFRQVKSTEVEVF